MSSGAEPIPWHRRVSVRIGVIVAALVLVADVGSWLLPDHVSSDEGDVAALEEIVERYERTGVVAWFTAAEKRALIRDSLIFAFLLALFAIWLVSRTATRRLSRLAREASSDVDSLPGPFEVRGRDEISSLATSLNEMRGRVVELLGELEQRDGARRAWIAQVSHDLRTPMTALTVALERARTLVERGDDADREEARALLAAAALDGRRVHALTDDLLEIARLDTEDALEREPVPLGQLVRETVDALAPVAKERGIELACDAPQGLPTIAADGRRLQRALENLLSNGLRHASSRVELAVELDGSRALLTVSDDGSGFEEEPGELTNERLSVLPGRTGSARLGLQVVLRVAQAHGGRVRAVDGASGGARVSIELPLGVDAD